MARSKKPRRSSSARPGDQTITSCTPLNSTCPRVLKGLILHWARSGLRCDAQKVPVHVGVLRRRRLRCALQDEGERRCRAKACPEAHAAGVRVRQAFTVRRSLRALGQPALPVTPYTGAAGVRLTQDNADRRGIEKQLHSGSNAPVHNTTLVLKHGATASTRSHGNTIARLPTQHQSRRLDPPLDERGPEPSYRCCCRAKACSEANMVGIRKPSTGVLVAGDS
jgi:hypothetical protein